VVGLTICEIRWRRGWILSSASGQVNHARCVGYHPMGRKELLIRKRSGYIRFFIWLIVNQLIRRSDWRMPCGDPLQLSC